MKEETTTRRSGRSTRIIDKLVQDFFIKGLATGRDHNVDPQNRYAKENLKRVMNRLMSEHGLMPSVHFIIDLRKLLIRKI